MNMTNQKSALLETQHESSQQFDWLSFIRSWKVSKTQKSQKHVCHVCHVCHGQKLGISSHPMEHPKSKHSKVVYKHIYKLAKLGSKSPPGPHRVRTIQRVDDFPRFGPVSHVSFAPFAPSSRRLQGRGTRDARRGEHAQGPQGWRPGP